MNKLDKQYTDLLQDILDNGVVKGDRTGTGTISVFGRQIRHNMKDGFPLLTTKKMPFKTIVTELLWFLRGDTNIKFLVDNNCHIWNGDAYKRYSITMGMTGQVESLSQEEFINKIKEDDEFAKKWGELGPIYGNQWRKWNERYSDWKKFDGGVPPDGVELIAFAHKGLMTRKKLKGIDQIQNLINDLKTNPDSRRLMVNAWNVGELDQMVLPPCHYGFQVYTRDLDDETRYNIWFNNNYETGMERYFNPGDLPDYDNTYYEATPKRAISLMWNQRSVDTFLGLPFNIASYALLLEIIASEVNMVPDQLIGNLGDVHLYSNHLEQAKEQIARQGLDLPSVEINKVLKSDNESLPLYNITDFKLNDYQSHETIKAPLSN
jgi:thymidylate synthase